jgi:hypothetical protein
MYYFLYKYIAHTNTCVCDFLFVEDKPHDIRSLSICVLLLHDSNTWLIVNTK